MEILINLLLVVFGIIGAALSLVVVTVGIVFTGLIINGVIEEIKRKKEKKIN